MKTKAISLSKAFGAAALAGTLAACSTTGYDRRASLEVSARVMTASQDVGIRAAGAQTLAELHPEIDRANENVRGLATPGNVQCQVQNVTPGANGQQVVRLGNCGTVKPGPQ